MRKDILQVSILISAHNEGILAHKTLQSIKRSVSMLEKHSITYEIIATLDSPTQDTIDYFSSQEILQLRVVVINEGDLSSNRIAGIKEAKGQYVAIIDADDLCSKNWFFEAYELCRMADNYVVHTEYSISFEGMDILWHKTDSLSIEAEAVYNVQANRWDSALVAPRSLMEKYLYRANRGGFGSEDWDFNMRTIADGVKHKVAPKTVLFVRRKESGSEMDKQRLEKRVVRPSDLLSLERFRGIVPDNYRVKIADEPSSKQLMIRSLRAALRVYRPVAHRITIIRKAGSATKLLLRYDEKKSKMLRKDFPDWLIHEWAEIHSVEKELFPSDETLRKTLIYKSENIEFGSVYKLMADATRLNAYDYVFFVPYLHKGGADLVAIKYANAIKRLEGSCRICVIATEDHESQWASRLDPSIDFISFGEMTAGMDTMVKQEILARFVTNIGPKYIHIINSKLAYQFIRLYSRYLTAVDCKIFACAFCEDISPDGHVKGYIHTELPKVYNLISRVFTDNTNIIKTLCDEYGYSPEKFVCHYIPTTLSERKKVDYSNKNKLLWAGRISFQKQPEVLRAIAERLETALPEVVIDAYGSFDQNTDKGVFNGSKNIQYKGGFNNGLATLPIDDYDGFIYTSLYDGIPNVLLECAGLGLPVITPLVGGISEICEDEKTALTIKHQSAIDEYINKISQLYEMSNEQRMTLAHNLNNLVARNHNDTKFDLSIEQDIFEK